MDSSRISLDGGLNQITKKMPQGCTLRALYFLISRNPKKVTLKTLKMKQPFTSSTTNKSHKCITKSHTMQPLFAGLRNTREEIEFFGNPQSLTVQWLQDGIARPFDELPPKYYTILLNAMNMDKKARIDLEVIRSSKGRIAVPSLKRRVELYTYYCYGALDHTADIIDGVLQPTENYRHTKDCFSLNWESKDITIHGIPLLPREIKMLDLFAQDFKDQVVAIELGIASDTLNIHKRSLYKKARVQSKPALMLRAFAEQVIAPVQMARV